MEAKVKNLFLIFIILVSSISAHAANIGDDTVSIGQKGSTADKSLIFRDANSTQIGVDHVTGDVTFTSNNILLGDGTDTNKKIKILEGINTPYLGYNSATNKMVFSHDGVAEGTMGSVSSTVVAKTSNATLATSGEDIITLDATSATFTITLPTAVGSSGLTYNLTKINDTNSVIIDPSGSETVGGFITYTLKNINKPLVIASNGTGWIILSSVNATTSSYTESLGKGMRIESCKIDMTSGTPISGSVYCDSWIDSYTDNGVGQAGLNIISGIFSTAPVCATGSNGNTHAAVTYATTTTLVEVETRSVGNNLFDHLMQVICVGEK